MGLERCSSQGKVSRCVGRQWRAEKYHILKEGHNVRHFVLAALNTLEAHKINERAHTSGQPKGAFCGRISV